MYIPITIKFHPEFKGKNYPYSTYFDGEVVEDFATYADAVRRIKTYLQHPWVLASLIDG